MVSKEKPTDCHFQQQVTPGRYAVDDFNFEIPTADLRTSIQGQGSQLRIYEYAAGFSNKDQGDNKVKRRMHSRARISYQAIRRSRSLS